MRLKKIVQKSCVGLLVCSAMYAYGADAAASVWTLSDSGPKGDASGTLATMLAAPMMHPSTIYLSSFLNDGPVFYESTDGCKTWQPGPTIGLPPDTTVSLNAAVSDSEGNIYNVFANNNPMGAAQDTVFELPLGQKSWVQKTNAGLPTGWQISALTLDKTGNIYAGIVSSDLKDINIYKLAPEGKKWTKLSVPDLEDNGAVFIVTALEVDSSGNLYAAIENAGVYELAAGRMTWTALNDGLPESTTTNPVFLMQMLNDGQGNLYLATNYGIFKLSQGSSTWMPENQGLDSVIAEAQQSANIETLSLSIGSNGILYADTIQGVMQLQSDGTWVAVPVDAVLNQDVYGIAVNTDNKLCVTTAKGVFVQN